MPRSVPCNLTLTQSPTMPVMIPLCPRTSTAPPLRAGTENLRRRRARLSGFFVGIEGPCTEWGATEDENFSEHSFASHSCQTEPCAGVIGPSPGGAGEQPAFAAKPGARPPTPHLPLIWRAHRAPQIRPGSGLPTATSNCCRPQMATAPSALSAAAVDRPAGVFELHPHTASTRPLGALAPWPSPSSHSGNALLLSSLFVNCIN